MSASSAVPLSHSINSPMGPRSRKAAPINHGSEACALRALPQARAAQRNVDSVTARRLFFANMFVPPFPWPGAGGGFEVRDGRPSNTFPGLQVAIGSGGVGRATIKHQDLATLDPVFDRDRSVRSVRFSIMEE